MKKVKSREHTKHKRGSFESKRHSFIRSALRRSSMRWPPLNEAMKLARVSRGKYLCAMCKGIFGPKEVIKDHIEPVVPVTGFTTWDDYSERLFCKVEGVQIICTTCSDIKTSIEAEMRTSIKNNAK